MLAWLARCATALKPGGIIVVKENLANGNDRFTLGIPYRPFFQSDGLISTLFPWDSEAKRKHLRSKMRRKKFAITALH